MREEDESPYCEVCGTCGIRNFIEEHIEGKTNCKNEDIIINELINLCDYKDEVFKENERLHSIIKEAREYIETNLDNTGWLEIGSNDVKELLEILDKEIQK